MEELEETFIKALAVGLSQPQAAKQKLSEIKKIHWRLNRSEPLKTTGDCLIACIEEAKNKPVSYILILKRLNQNIQENPYKNKILEIIRKNKENAYDTAAWRLSELIVHIIIRLPAQSGDRLTNIRKQALDVVRATEQEGDNDDEEIMQPFAGLEAGDPLSHQPIITKPSGIPAMDSGILNSGFVNGAGIIISGPTNIGKSNLTNEFIRASAFIGGSPLQISIEDDRKLTQLRWTSFLLGIDTKAVNSLTNEEKTALLLKKYEKMPWAIKAIERMRLWAPKEPPTMEKILRKIDEFEEKSGIKITLTALDYIQNLDTSGGGSNRATQLEMAAKRYISVGAQKGRTSLIVSQAKSSSDSTDEFLPVKDAMAESFAISHNAHYIFSLRHPAEEITRRMRERDDPRNKINVGLVKNKFGPVGGLYSIFDGKRSKWEFYNTKNEREASWNQNKKSNA